MVKNNNRDKNGENGIDMFKWLNFVTFDIVTDLAFGESFETVKTGSMTGLCQSCPTKLTFFKEHLMTGSR
jgi:hypothetical protein